MMDLPIGLLLRNLDGWVIAPTLAAEPANPGGPPLPGLSAAPGNPGPMTDIHDIKPALDLGHELAWLYWVLAAAVLLILAVLVFRLWKKRQQPAAGQVAVPLVPPETEALRMLDELATDADPNPKPFYFRLSAIVRRYVERRFDICAAEMTTEELLPEVDRLPLDLELAARLKAFCRAADPVKFAGASVDKIRMDDDLAFARRFVHQTAVPVDAQGGSETPGLSMEALQCNAVKALPLAGTVASAHRRLDE